MGGTYPFTLARSVKGYRLNKFLHGLIDPAWREKFRNDRESAFEAAVQPAYEQYTSQFGDELIQRIRAE